MFLLAGKVRTGGKRSGLGYRQQVEPKALVAWGLFPLDPTLGPSFHLQGNRPDK